MKHYLRNGDVLAFEEDGSQDHLITDDMEPISDAELAEMRSPSLADVEFGCLGEVDAKASSVRDRFITSGTGQSAVYLTKYEEARAYKAATSPTNTDYPYLDKEAARRGMTVGALADEVIATRNAWTDPAGATIEAERVGGKADVRAASTVADKEAARDAAIATLDGIQP